MIENPNFSVYFEILYQFLKITYPFSERTELQFDDGILVSGHKEFDFEVLGAVKDISKDPIYLKTVSFDRLRRRPVDFGNDLFFQIISFLILYSMSLRTELTKIMSN